MSKEKKDKQSVSYRKVAKKALKLIDRDFYEVEDVSAGMWCVKAADQMAVSDAEVRIIDEGDRIHLDGIILNAEKCMTVLNMSREDIRLRMKKVCDESGYCFSYMPDDENDDIWHISCSLSCDPEDIEPVLLAVLVNDIFEQASALTATLFAMYRFRPDDA